MTVLIEALRGTAGTGEPGIARKTGPTKVVIVDNDGVVRAGLTMMLGCAPDLKVVGSAADGDEAMRQIGRSRPDVVLMDIRKPQWTAWR